MIAFLDASALIYLIEGAEPFGGKVRAAMKRLRRSHPQIGIALSRLSWLECRVRPARLGDAAVLAAYDGFFAQPDLHWIELSREVIEQATALRVAHALRTPDALQAACCLQLGPRHRFVTGDADFSAVAGLHLLRVAG